MMEISAVMLWWGILWLVAIINLVLWFYTFQMLKERLPTMATLLQYTRNWQWRLAFLYTVGCGSRGMVPRGDLRRIVMIDCWFSSIVVGRTIATIAELSFVAQWCFLLYEAGKATGHKTILLLAKLPFPIIVVAEICSWYACTTSNYIGTTIEESLWTVAAVLTTYGLYLARPYYEGAQKTFLTRGMIAGLMYIVYMVLVDVPAYVSGWMTDQANGKVYKTIGEGLTEISTQWHVTYAYADWRYEMVWMSLYFSVCVWGSIYLINAPALDQNLKEQPAI